MDGVVFGASLPGAGLPGALPVSGIVLGGEADGARSLFGLSPTRPPWLESVQPATSAVNSTNPQSPDTSVLILFILPGRASPSPCWTDVVLERLHFGITETSCWRSSRCRAR